jgi:hypothetical protein
MSINDLMAKRRLIDRTYEQDSEVKRLRVENAELRAALNEAVLQIEYLHEKFRETGSGNAVVARIRNLLT